MAGMDGFGSELRRGDGATPEVYTAIANVTSLSGPAMERETIDVTAHDSPEQWMEFIGGLKDGGEVSMDVNYHPGEGTHNLLQDDFDDTAARNFRLVFPDPDETAWQLSLILTGLEPEYPYDEKLECSCTWKVTGKPTLTILGS